MFPGKCLQLPTNRLSVFDHFVGLALKGSLKDWALDSHYTALKTFFSLMKMFLDT